MSERAGLFDGDTDFDVSGFAPRKTVPPTESASPEKIRKVSEASSFRSREPAPAKLTPQPKREPRRHRTGRNVQLSLKVRAETRGLILCRRRRGRMGTWRGPRQGGRRSAKGTRSEEDCLIFAVQRKRAAGQGRGPGRLSVHGKIGRSLFVF